MTSKEFEVMRNAQKYETKLATLRELDSIRAEINLKSKMHNDGDYYIKTCDVLAILEERIKENEQ